MNRWEEQLANHQIHGTLETIRGFVETKHEFVNADIEIERRRLLKVLRLIEEQIEALDAEVAPFNALDTLDSALRNAPIWNELRAYRSDGDVNHLKTANNELMLHLRVVHSLQLPTTKSNGTKLIKSLEKQFDQFLEVMSSRTSSLTDELSSLSEKQHSLKTKFEELFAASDQRRAEIDSLVSGWQSQFSDAQNERAKQFEETRISLQNDFINRTTQAIKERENSLQKRDKEFENEIQKITQSARDKHKDILALHEIVAGDSVAAGYLQNATEERKQADFWRWASIVFIVATAAWTIAAYVRAPTGDLQGLAYWGQALKAFSVTAVLLFGAVYSAKQSNLHRHNEQKTRWLALEVKAIDPFIASLSPNEQKELKKSLSEKLFGHMNNLDATPQNAINDIPWR